MNLGGTFKRIKELQSLDEQGQVSEAFGGYLEVITDLLNGMNQAKVVAELEGQNVVTIKHGEKLFSLIRNCLDRAESLTLTKSQQEAGKSLSSSNSSESIPLATHANNNGNANNHANNGNAGANISHNNVSPNAGSSTVKSPPNQPRRTVSYSAIPSSTNGSVDDAIEAEDYVQQTVNGFFKAARRKNKVLLQNYQQKLNSLDPQARSELNIRLHRLMQENMEIAKSKKEEFEKKLHEKMQRREENQKSAQQQLIERRKLASIVSIQGAFSDLFDNLSQMLTDFGDSDLEKEFMRAITAQNNDSLITYQEVAKLLRSPKHPFGRHFQEYICQFKLQYQADLTNTDEKQAATKLQTMIPETHAFIGNLYGKMLERYKILQGGDNEVYLKMSIEDELFAALSHVIMLYYEAKNRSSDDVLTAKILNLQDLTPQDLGIKEKFWLTPTPNSVDPGLNSYFSMPYGLAISLMKKLPMNLTPTQKASCIAKVMKEVTVCIHSYWQALGVDCNNDRYSVGADDLLPIFCYIIIRTNPPSLKSQSLFMSEFINEALAMGEEGYSVATLETVIDFLNDLRK